MMMETRLRLRLQLGLRHHLTCSLGFAVAVSAVAALQSFSNFSYSRHMPSRSCMGTFTAVWYSLRACEDRRKRVGC